MRTLRGALFPRFHEDVLGNKDFSLTINDETFSLCCVSKMRSDYRRFLFNIVLSSLSYEDHTSLNSELILEK